MSNELLPHQNNMFDLNAAVKEWRRRLAADGLKSSAVLDELESHLREAVQTQVRSGNVPEQAFALAVAQIGRADKLKAEFAKVEDVRKMRSRENLRRWSVVIATGFVFLTNSLSWYFGVRSGKIEITALDIVLGAGAIVPMILFGWTGRSLAKFLPVINEKWVITFTLAVLFFAAALFRIFFPMLSPANLVHVQIVALWALSPMIGFGNCVSAWFDRCAGLRKKAA